MSTPIPNGRAQTNAVYGNPAGGDSVDPTWFARNIVSVELPYRMVLSWDRGQTVRKVQFHRLAADDLKAILAEIWNQVRAEVKKKHGYGLKTPEYDKLTYARLRELGLDILGGTFNYRPIRGAKSLSTHSYGIAIDFDPARNGLGDHDGAMPGWVVEIFERYGWVWGGRWTRPDFMHFQRARGV